MCAVSIVLPYQTSPGMYSASPLLFWYQIWIHWGEMKATPFPPHTGRKRLWKFPSPSSLCSLDWSSRVFLYTPPMQSHGLGKVYLLHYLGLCLFLPPLKKHIKLYIHVRTPTHVTNGHPVYWTQLDTAFSESGTLKECAKRQCIALFIKQRYEHLVKSLK